MAKKLGALVAASVLGVACSGEGISDVGRSSQAVVGWPDIMSFDSTTYWSSLTGQTIGTSTTIKVQGLASMTVAASGWTDLLSGPVPSLPPVTNKLALRIRLPSPAANPYWAGDVQLFLDDPPAGLHNQAIGQRLFAGLPLGAFQEIVFPLSAEVVQKLQNAHFLRFRVILNVPTGAGTYHLDDLHFVSP